MVADSRCAYFQSVSIISCPLVLRRPLTLTGHMVFNIETPLGWDVMEPITYLTGFGMAIGGYLWFLWHNREVSYRTLLTETTSRRQQKLYAERGFDIDVYQELINDAKGLRRAIKRVAWDYELDWDQGNTAAGRNSQRALEIIRREEERDRRRRHREEGDEKEVLLGLIVNGFLLTLHDVRRTLRLHRPSEHEC